MLAVFCAHAQKRLPLSFRSKISQGRIQCKAAVNSFVCINVSGQ